MQSHHKQQRMDFFDEYEVESAPAPEPEKKLAKIFVKSTKTTTTTKRKAANAAGAKTAPRVTDAPDAIVMPPTLTLYELTLGGKKRKEKDLRIFRAVYHDSKEICDAIASLHELLTDVNLKFDSKLGLHIGGVVPNNTTQLLLQVPRRSFLEFSGLEGGGATKTDITVHSSHFQEIRSYCRTDYTLTFNRIVGASDVEHMTVQMHPARQSIAKDVQRQRTLPQMQLENKLPSHLNPRHFYQFRVVVRHSVIAQAIQHTKTRFADVSFKLSATGLEIITKDLHTPARDVLKLSYTESTNKDAAFADYDIFDDDAHLPESEYAMFEELNSKIALVHFNRLQRRTSICPHMMCTTDANGVPTCERFKEQYLEEEPVVVEETKDGEDSDSEDDNEENKKNAEPEEFEGGTARMSSLDNVRFRLCFVHEALKAAANSDYIEMFFGRCPPPGDKIFAPLLLRSRALNTAERRTSLVTMVYVSPKYDDK